MATMTSTHRGFGTPASLTVAPTQNTAPVLEFRCLYTRDAHKKSKRWHDGTVKFHTFNRRVMVRDDAQHAIGNMHYRREDEFGEGVELQLDCGVLVDVGERLGQTETDLAPLLDRQRADQVDSPRRQPVPLPARIQSTGQSQRPKSLLEVLGPSQGRLGRARIPCQSPYEQRHPPPSADPFEPPPKRQKLAPIRQEAAPVPTTRHFRQAARPRLPQSIKASKPALQSNRRADPPIDFEDVLDLSSDTESGPSTIQRATTAQKSQAQTPLQTRPPALCLSSRPSILPASRPGNIRGEEHTQHKQKPLATVLKPKESTETPSVSSGGTRPSARGKGRLLLSQPRPHRPTLACLRPVPSRTTSARCSTDRESAKFGQKRVARRDSAEAQSISGSLSSSRLPAISQRARDQIPSRPATPLPAASLPVHSDEVGSFSSPLFEPDEQQSGDSRPPTPLSAHDELDRFFDDDEHEMSDFLDHARGLSQPEAEIAASGTAENDAPKVNNTFPPASKATKHQTDADLEITLPNLASSQASLPAEESKDATSASSRQEKDTEKIIEEGTEFDCAMRQESPSDSDGQSTVEPEEPVSPKTSELDKLPRVESTVHIHIPPLPTTEQTLPKPLLQPRPKALGNMTSAKHPAAVVNRPFRRVFSENNALDDNDLSMVPLPAAVESRSPLQVLQNLSTRRSPAKFRSPTKINRSVSGLMTKDKSKAKLATTTEVSKGPTGPWTAEEAFLLFEVWPSDVPERPAFWTTVVHGARASRAAISMAEQPQCIRLGITTARQFLRDDVNAL